MAPVLPRLIPPTLAVAVLATPADAHVKWFAPYIVGASPRPISATLTDPFFWSGIVLVLVFFGATRAIEPTRVGAGLLSVMDHAGAALDRRLDDFMRAAIATFFVAIFSVGGIYLTPDLQTGNALIPWVQLGIAACVFFRATMPLAALGVVGLWVLALRDYDFFHLLDYLALGLGIAGYLWLAAADDPRLRRYRFDVVRWAVAISLMWSSLEKFAYPEWFYPLVVEKPFLTFGLPRDAFIPMAGVAEFTLGFGLLSTVLIRRLSAIALLVIFTAAVYPFGRTDLIGHGLIMAALLAVAAHAWPRTSARTGHRSMMLRIPASLSSALILFAGLYWGSHGLIYPQPDAAVAEIHATHSPDPDHPHAEADAPVAAPGRRGHPTQTALLVP